MVSQSASRNKNFTFFQNHSAEAVKIKKGDPGYAQPVGLTKQRGEKAKKHIYEVSHNSEVLKYLFFAICRIKMCGFKEVCNKPMI